MRYYNWIIQRKCILVLFVLHLRLDFLPHLIYNNFGPTSEAIGEHDIQSPYFIEDKEYGLLDAITWYIVIPASFKRRKFKCKSLDYSFRNGVIIASDCPIECFAPVYDIWWVRHYFKFVQLWL